MTTTYPNTRLVKNKGWTPNAPNEADCDPQQTFQLSGGATVDLDRQERVKDLTAQTGAIGTLTRTEAGGSVRYGFEVAL